MTDLRHDAHARRAGAIIGVVFILVSFLLAAAGCTKPKREQSNKRVLVIGIDGMDPQLLGHLMETGRMPNFASLRRNGSFRLLRTSIPPQSPVAWSSILTGLNPGEHGIFDFIQRDPATMAPYLSIARVEPPKHTLSIGDWELPIGGGETTLLRRGKAFWQFLDDWQIPSTIIRMPVNYPPVRTRARTLAGMGTPDLQGTYGIFSYYTNDPMETSGPRSGGEVFAVQVQDSRFSAKIPGPHNRFRKGRPQATVDFEVRIDRADDAVKIVIQDNEFRLREKEWSDWIRVRFTLVPGLVRVNGICRWYLKQVRPHIQLYVSPTNLDPSRPAYPISTPPSYARELWKEIGFYYTQGIAEDTKALSNGILDESEYLEHARIVLDEQLRMFDLELNRFHAGLLFCYFSSLDQNSHMFWPSSEERSPKCLSHPGESPGPLAAFYEEMDRMLGKAITKLDDHTTLLVLSDHGFAPFGRSFELNTWLVQNGYMVIKNSKEPQGGDIFGMADWARTRAYGMGLTGLYLNQLGREPKGIVRSGHEANALLEDIAGKLLAVRDPATGLAVITRADKARDVYSGPNVSNAPDLIIGYNRGFRAGWQTAVGGLSSAILENNTELWNGDHCIDYTLVPGILLSNRKVTSDAPSLTDVAPTILGEFGIRKPECMSGQSFFQK